MGAPDAILGIAENFKSSTHYGIAGYYASMASEAGYVGFTGTNTRPSIAPTFVVEPMLGALFLCGVSLWKGFSAKNSITFHFENLPHHFIHCICII